MGPVGRQLGLRVGMEGVQTAACFRWGAPSNQGLFQGGDVIVGGLFNLHYQTPVLDRDFKQQPNYKTCTG